MITKETFEAYGTVAVFTTYKSFCQFIMEYDGELTVKNAEIYKDEVLIGRMSVKE